MRSASPITSACKYSSGNLIPIFQSLAVAELKIEGPLEYMQVQATTLVSLPFYLYDSYIDSKITNFSLYLFKLLYSRNQHLSTRK